MFIAVATHKKIDYELPNGYNPVQINSSLNERWEGYYHDSDGENIAEKNYCYCELTAMYWLWKNVNSDIKGLCHYRRLFSNNFDVTMSEMDYFEGEKVKSHILSEEQIQYILKDYAAIVVRPYRPYPLKEKDDLAIWCYESDLNVLKKIIYNDYPDYISSYEKIMQSTNISHYNMLVADSNIFNDYSEWLFKILEKVEKNTNIESYDVQHKRIYGYLAEMLLNVYIDKRSLKVKYVKVIEPAEFVDLTYKGVKKSQFFERIQKLAIRFRVYKLIEQIVRMIRKDKYKKYKAMKERMR